jgi:Lon protease-like protein
MPELALFPLNTVLFPGGLLPLRIFEPRYLDMVGRCMREGADFGVVLITSGEEAGRSRPCHRRHWGARGRLQPAA